MVGDGMSYRALHALAVREAERVEYGRACERVRVATHVAIGIRDKRVSCYGTRAECERFATGLEREVRVEPMSDEQKQREYTHLSRVYRPR